MSNAFEDMEFHIRGTAALLMHNGALADPLNVIAQKMKEISSKRNKTEADYEALARLEHQGGLYLDASYRVVVPGVNIEAMLLKSAKRVKKGEQAKSGLWSAGDWPLIYKGPKCKDAKKPEAFFAEIFADKRFVDRRAVVVSKSRVMRTRPIFPEWELKFTVSYSPVTWNPRDVANLVKNAGEFIGMLELAPKFGRFELAEAGEKAKAA